MHLTFIERFLKAIDYYSLRMLELDIENAIEHGIVPDKHPLKKQLLGLAIARSQTIALTEMNASLTRQHDQRWHDAPPIAIDRPARIGGIIFGPGVRVSTVLNAAYSAAEEIPTEEELAIRRQRFADLQKAIREPSRTLPVADYTPYHPTNPVLGNEPIAGAFALGSILSDDSPTKATSHHSSDSCSSYDSGGSSYDSSPSSSSCDSSSSSSSSSSDY